MSVSAKDAKQNVANLESETSPPMTVRQPYPVTNRRQESEQTQLECTSAVKDSSASTDEDRAYIPLATELTLRQSSVKNYVLLVT